MNRNRPLEELTRDDAIAIQDLYKIAIFNALNHHKDKECLYYIDLLHETMKEIRTLSYR